MRPLIGKDILGFFRLTERRLVADLQVTSLPRIYVGTQGGSERAALAFFRGRKSLA